MKLGFLTVCLGNMELKEKAKWASENGFEALEIACWPQSNSRDYSSCDIDVTTITKEKADIIKAYMREYGLIISSLAYYDNNLDKDLKKRAMVNNHVKKVIDAAVLLETPYVGTFTGRNIDLSIKDNFSDFEDIFKNLVAYAESKGIKLMIENCDMRGWQKPGEAGTISFSPELWEEMFRRIPNKSFGLNYDPSHLIQMLMEYISPIDTFADRIFHVHAKDGKVLEDMVKYYGVFDKQLGKPNEFGYRKAKMPGLGDIDWKSFFKALKDIKYDYVISIEHEDMDYSSNEGQIKEGLLIAKKNIEGFIK